MEREILKHQAGAHGQGQSFAVFGRHAIFGQAGGKLPDVLTDQVAGLVIGQSQGSEVLGGRPLPGWSEGFAAFQGKHSGGAPARGATASHQK